MTSESLPVSMLRTCDIIDGQALVESLGKPTGAKTFGELAESFIAPALSHSNINCTRVDVVFYRYTTASIKAGTRSKREGRTRSVLCKIDSRDIPLPVNWKSYIDLPENKANLTISSLFK